MTNTNRALSVKFDGMPSLRTLIEELQRASKYLPADTQLAGLNDNGSTESDLREITFIFEKDGYIHGA